MTTPEAPNHSLARVTVLNPGIYSLLVDFGRPHSRGLGVPVGGAADRAALSIGNALVGNPPDSVGVEISLAGPTLRTDAEIAAVVYGAPFAMASDRQSLEAGKTLTLHPGDELRIGGTNEGMRAYLCVRGGFHSTRGLESCWGLQQLLPGAILTCSSGTTNAHFVLDGPHLANPHVLHFLPGRQADWFGPDTLFRRRFTVRPESNRMGVRLSAPALEWERRELLSEAVCPGTGQVTNDGQCIGLGRDAQTIGGYPKIPHLLTASHDKPGQLPPR